MYIYTYTCAFVATNMYTYKHMCIHAHTGRKKHVCKRTYVHEYTLYVYATGLSKRRTTSDIYCFQCGGKIYPGGHDPMPQRRMYSEISCGSIRDEPNPSENSKLSSVHWAPQLLLMSDKCADQLESMTRMTMSSC